MMLRNNGSGTRSTSPPARTAAGYGWAARPPRCGSTAAAAERTALPMNKQLGELVVVAKCRNSLCLNPSHLTAATKKQVQNRRDRPNRNNRNSGVRNVYRDRDRWRAQITADGVAIHIGTFHCIEDADAAVRKARAA
jgi:hypothetical protein